MTNPLIELEKAGQSVWYDQMERKLVTTGKLKKMIEEDHLRGLTSNPTIFEKAIAGGGGGSDYDMQLRELATQGKNRDEIFEDLEVDDLSKAADIFLPVYKRTGGDDGFVSLELVPGLAHDTKNSITEAKRMFERMARPNVMIKIPATPEGLPAIEESIFNGININITLIFSNDVYRNVAEAYIRGLERRVEKKLPIGDIRSVASFFVSRIDTQADKQIEAKIAATKDESQKKELESLLGKVAISNAKLAYQAYNEIFSSARWKKLEANGGRPQRQLWASTGTKNPKYSDVYYVEALIGPDTIDTVPPATYDAFRDHGKVTMTLEKDLGEAKRVMDGLGRAGISLEKITTQLTAEGVKSFIDSFDSLLGTIEGRRDLATRQLAERQIAHLGPAQQVVDQAVQRADKDKFVPRIWSKDATLWKSDDAHKKIIRNALGWLGVVADMREKAGELKQFAESVRSEFDDVVVLGMGGSSLCSEVIRRVFGTRKGYPTLSVLDSTVPEAVRNLEASLDLAKTLFIVASKSGTTTEPMVFHRYFYDRVKSVRGGKAGRNFIAITDPNTQLGKDAERDGFRKIFINPADIGGRYSALSYFGMVPAAISGVDVEGLLDRALHAAHIASLAAVRSNPPAYLGAILGTMALEGKDKLTLITPPPLDTLGLWIEQLIAESTGKEGKGIVPIAGEPLGDPGQYGDDRLFVAIRMRQSDGEVRSRLKALIDRGQPIIDQILEDPLDLGETFFVWEFATAVAGALLGIDAFDQPNVQESKDNTKRILEEFRKNGKLQEQDVVARSASATIYSSKGSRGPAGSGAPEDAIAALLAMVGKGDYVALTEYFAQTKQRDALLEQIRSAIARELHVATTTGYGPRFLHSTGQLHKGGPGSGVFLQLTASDRQDVPIPGEPFTFGVLKQAQSLGDFQSLASRNRRALRIDLGSDVDKGLQWLLSTVTKALAKREAISK
jgi:transaldolase / glucose-6-phosphate isomerase